MKKSKLILLLSKLSAKEFKKLHKFVASPYFNKREILLQLLTYLAHHLHNDNQLTKEKAYQHLYPQKPFNDQDLRLLMSYLYKLVEKFIAYTEIEDDHILIQHKKLTAFRKRNLLQQAQRTLKNAQEQLNQQPLRNDWYYEQTYQLGFETYLSELRNNPNQDLKLQAVSNAIDTTFFIRKLHQACLQLAHKSVYTSNYDLGFAQYVIQHIQEQQLLCTPAITTYYYCYLMLQEPSNNNHFLDLKQSLLEHSQIFAKNERRDFYLLSINYCIKQINDGNETYFSQVLELYKWSLSNDVLVENNVLSRFSYYNVVMAAIKTKDYDWASDFIHSYKKFLEPIHRENYFTYTLAFLAYSRQNYDDALLWLQKSNYKDPLLNLTAKSMLAQVYYEIGEINALESLLEAMQTFIRRKRVIGYHKTNYLNIIRYTKRVLHVNPYDRVEVAKLRSSIEQEEVLSSKKWLLKQVDQF